jgi:putative hemolysin
MQDLLFSYAEPTDSLPKRMLIRAIEVATGQPRLKRIYEDNARVPRPGESFWAAAVRRLELDIRVSTSALRRIPKNGPLVIVANHPFGVIDGLAIAWLIEQVRSDFRILTNAVLLRAPEVRPYVLPVDFTGTPEAEQTNLASRHAARAHLAAGGCVIVFPAGGVSTSPDRFGRRPAEDAPWQPFTAALIQRSRAAVVPIWFHGQNSRAFQIASHIALTLRLALLFKEVRDRIGTSIDVAVGEPIPYAELASLRDRRLLAAHLRAATERLACHGAGDSRLRPAVAPRKGGGSDLPCDPLAAFLAGLDSGQRRRFDKAL